MSTPPEKEAGFLQHRNQARLSHLDGLEFRFKEAMSGYLGVGQSDPQRAFEQGRSEKTPLRFDVQIRIVDLGRFLRLPEHGAELAGTVTFDLLGGTFAIQNGRFNLFTVDETTGVRQMVYEFRFTAADGATYYLHGTKSIHSEPGGWNVLADMTRLSISLLRTASYRVIPQGTSLRVVLTPSGASEKTTAAAGPAPTPAPTTPTALVRDVRFERAPSSIRAGVRLRLTYVLQVLIKFQSPPL